MIIGALLNSRSSVPVNRIVLSRGPAMLATRYCTKLVLSFDDIALKITAVSQPMRTLGTMQTIAVRRGLTLKSATPKVLIPKHWMKLVIPNTAPRNSPPTGPSRTAPMMTGIVMNVISIAPALR